MSPAEIDMKSLLRTSPEDCEIEDFIRRAVFAKPASRFSNVENMNVGMNLIGG